VKGDKEAVAEANAQIAVLVFELGAFYSCTIRMHDSLKLPCSAAEIGDS
jgi:hypothetical protein